MKVYEFRLATVERVRKLEEKIARERLIESLRTLQMARDANEAAYTSLRMTAAASGIVAMSDIQWLDDQRDRLAESLRVCAEMVERAEAQSAEARTAWQVAAKRAGALERLDAHGYGAWRDESLRAEIAESDDLALARYRVAGARE